MSKLTRLSFLQIETNLKGLGQIMLQENSITGLLFLAGIFYGSFTFGIAAILSVCIGTLSAVFLNFDEGEIRKGIYGFNAALVGIAIITTFKPSFIIWCLIVVGAIVATLIHHLFYTKHISSYTLAFVLTTWILLFFFNKVYPLPQRTIISNNDTLGGYILFRNYGQVIFQSSILSGVMFFTGVFANSRIAAIYGVLSGLISTYISSLWYAPADMVQMGLLGYNAVLIGIAFSGKSIRNILWVICAITLSVIISFVLYKTNITPLTFPFVAATVSTNYLIKITTKAHQ